MSTSSQTLRPRRLSHSGRIRCAGFVLRNDHLSQEEIQRRVFDVWAPGCSLHAWEKGVVFRWATPRSLFVDDVPGGPLEALPNGSSDVPLSSKERQLLLADARTGPWVVLTEAGQSRKLLLREMKPLDPATWIEVDAVQWRQLRSLAPPPPPLQERLVEVDLKGNAVIAAGGTVAAELVSIFGKGETSAGPKSSAPKAATTGEEKSAPSFWERLFGGEGTTATADGGNGDAPVSPGSTFFERLFGFGGGSASRSKGGQSSAWGRALRSQVDKQQAQYLDDMMKMFEDSDLDRALKHAIGLNSNTRSSTASSSPSGRLGPRRDLRLHRFRGAGAGTVDGGPSLYDHLEGLYRAAFEKLVREGDIDRAAFVLLELLDRRDEAIAFLLKHKRVVEAAEIAEGRGCSPARVAELWARAGNLSRALLVARRAGVEAAVATALDLTKADVAPSFRLLWANGRAVGGDYESAVKALGTLAKEHRALAQKWTDLGAAVGGPAGARLLASRLDEQFPVDEAAIEMARELIRSTAIGSPRLREQFAKILADIPGSVPELLMDALARRLVEDATTIEPGSSAALVVQISKRAFGVGTDFPQIHPPTNPPTLFDRDWPLIEDIDVRDAGGAPIFDAVRLPHNRLLLARGAAGVAIVDATTGAVKRRFFCHAEALVVSASKDRALVLSARSGDVDVWRLNLSTGATQQWRTIALTAFSDRYDGTRWAIAEDRTLMVLDTLDDEARVLWRAPAFQGPLLALTEGLQLSFVVGPMQESMAYELPGMVCRRRVPFERYSAEAATPSPFVAIDAVTGAGLVCVETTIDSRGRTQSEVFSFWNGKVQTHFRLDAEAMPVGRCVFLESDCVAIPVLDLGGASVRVHARATGVELAHLRFEGAHQVALREDGGALLAFDDRGRVVQLNVRGPEFLTPTLVPET